MHRFLSHRIRAVLAALVLIAVSAPRLHGQDQPPEPTGESDINTLKNLTLEQLAAIELTSTSKESTDAFRTPAAISIITRQDIARSGATSIPDLLRLVPGVSVAQISSNKWAIGIRGFQGYLSKAVLVLIDGRSVYTPLFAGVYWEMQDTLLEDIERIEVIRGPGGTVWGANAVNGVINIITRNAKDTRSSLITASTGNVEQGLVSARFGDGNNSFAYRIWGKGFTRGPQFHNDGDSFDYWRRAQFGYRTDWTPTQRDNVTVSGGFYTQRAGSRIAISTYSPPALVTVQDDADFFGQNITAAWRRKFQSGSDIQVHAYYDRTDRRDLNYREIRNTVDFDFIHHVSAGRNDFVWGLGYRTSPSHFFQTVPSVVFFPEKETYSITSGFAQDSITLVPNRLTAIVGTKVEHNSYSSFEIQPSGRLAWTPSSQQTIWGAVTRAVRTPSRLEQGFNFSALIAPSLPLYVRLVGDGQFDSEQETGYELGYRAYLKKRGFFSINGYYNRFDNLLSVESQAIVPENLPMPSHLVLPLLLRNGIDAQTTGVESTLLWDVSSWFRFRSSYSYMQLNAQRDPASNDASTERQLEGDSPKHKVVAQSLFTLPRDVTADLTFRYLSVIPDQNVASYLTADARIAKRLGREFEISLQGRNLFQPHHPEYGGLPGGLVEIRRSYYFKLSWTR